MNQEMMWKLRSALEDWISEKFIDDMKYFYDKFSTDFNWFRSLNDARKAALIEIAAFMGYKNLCGLSGLFSAIEQEDFESAACSIEENLSFLPGWRTARLAYIMESGYYGR